jgi:exonuclease SbcC
MKINAIRIKNLASLEGTTEIDFTSEPLASAGIFAITGPTGAGKSTLLDALCLALYGKTPRYLQAKEMGIEIHDVQGSTMSQGDVRGILRDGTSEGYAEVDFVGTDRQNYRSTWSVRRARNKAEGSLQADTISLKNTSTHIDLPGKKAETFKEIERLVGLNFEQFTRSVLLAQGDFTAFMKASKDEKSSLLEKLTGTQIYSEISKKIFANYKNEEQLLRDLNVRQEGIATLSEIELSEIQEQELVLATQINQLSEEIEALSKEINWHERFVLLQTNKVSAEINLQKANEFLVQSKIRKDKLFEVEQAQTTRSWNDALTYNEKQKFGKEAILAAIKTKITAIQFQKAMLDEQFQKDELHYSQVLEVQKEALPKLTAARTLDTLISEKEKQKKIAKTETELAKDKQELHQKEIAQKETDTAQYAAKLALIQDWKTKFSSKKPIAENKDLIVSKLSDAEKLVSFQKFATAEKSILDKKIAFNTAEINRFSTELKKLEGDLGLQQKVFETHSIAVLLTPIEQLEIDKDKTDQLLNAAIDAQLIWNVVHDLQTDFEALRQKQTQDQAAFLVTKTNLNALKTQLELDFVAKETSDKLLQKARLSASENVEQLRKSLTDNEPCPVCGSEEHPYILHNPPLEKVLTTLEDLHKQNEKVYLDNFGKSNQLEQELKSLTALIEKQETDIDSNKEFLTKKCQVWETTLISEESRHLEAEEKSNWIDAKTKKLKVLQGELQGQIKAHSNQKNQLEKERILLDKLKENTAFCNVKIKDSNSQLGLYNQKSEGLNKELSQFEIALKAIRNDLSAYFVASDWLEKWIDKPVEFVSSIINFSQEWNSKMEQLEYFKNEYSLATATLVQFQNQDKNLNEAVLQKVNLYQITEDDFLKLNTDRNAIFSGISAEIMEQRLIKTTEEAQKNVELTKNNLQLNKIELVAAETSVAETSNSILILTGEIKSISTKIENWLTDYNFKFQKFLTYLELKELLTFTFEWIEKEQNTLHSFEKEKTKAVSILQERTQIFEQHSAKKSSERPLYDLQIIFKNAKTQNENFVQAKAAIGFKLKEDEANKHKIGGLLEEILAQSKTTDNWSKLNDIIGSADGKKFRQIAQEHTLEILLSYANKHLEDLTSRYKIERIPNTLGLQVVDLDMGDEIRTVYSLSGGESFLVSLALALGLASLSSSKMKVESLFIDEGFGSLDPNTLNVAMDALERLHNQGRKVCVISHVQEMTDRIPVQIKVSKKASGRSLVEVLGF